MDNFKKGKIACLIPAYKPSEKFLEFIEKIAGFGYQKIIVVDDGGGEEFKSIFKRAEEKGCIVLTHEKNIGKGKALKTGFEYYQKNFKDGIGIITADADGQHSLKDIEHVAKKLNDNPDSLILGCRVFKEGVPFKSKFGNKITRAIYYLVSGVKISDTQTGLRGIPYSSLDKMLLVHGDRFEYEMSMLMEIKAMGISVEEVEIETIYLDDNSSSHFKAFKDSFLIYKMIFSYMASSFISFLVDYSMFTALTLILPNILANPDRLLFELPLLVILSNFGARVVSTLVNFSLNRRILLPKIRHDRGVLKHMGKYYIVAVIVLLLDTGLVSGMSLVMSKYIAKIISGAVIYVFNFTAQKRIVFV